MILLTIALFYDLVFIKMINYYQHFINHNIFNTIVFEKN